MNEMVERVAIAIVCKELGLTPEDWEDCFDGAKDRYRDLARAAIEALREPTLAMYEASRVPIIAGENAPIGDRWRAMIEEALK
jgi:hypothetical protein